MISTHNPIYKMAFLYWISFEMDVRSFMRGVSVVRELVQIVSFFFPAFTIVTTFSVCVWPFMISGKLQIVHNINTCTTCIAQKYLYIAVCVCFVCIFIVHIPCLYGMNVCRNDTFAHSTTVIDHTNQLTAFTAVCETWQLL